MAEFKPEDFINHRYRVERLLGRGAMGEVYLVEDMVKIQRHVALKVLKSENLQEADFWSKGEYEALTRLRHPNLARVHDFGRVGDSNDFYIVSEFIRGKDLLTATQSVAFEELLDIFAQICRALEYIHTQGYVHFDIKPDNILVTRERVVGSDEGSKVQWSPMLSPDAASAEGPPHVKLIDFGLAEKITGTFNFAIKGTFHYVAPEIIKGQTPDKRADLYSLGVTLYQLLTSRLPFIDDQGHVLDRARVNWRELVRRALQERPKWLVDIALRLLEEEPEARFPTARGIIQALNAGSGRIYELETAETQVSYLYCSRLVGRRKELNRLKEEADAVFPPITARPGDRKPTGDTSIVTRMLREDSRKRAPFYIISGEIGVGKSRLFEEFTHLLKMREIPVHVGNCYETSHDPYQPFREIIEQIALAHGLESELFQKHSVVVRRLCPRLRSTGDDDSDDTALRPDIERLCFIEGLANFLLDSSVKMPCVINLNNLHWADEASMDLLACLIEKSVQFESSLPHGLPMMLMATLRVDEALPEAPRRVLQTLREEDRIKEIPVRRFTRPQIAELIHSMLQLEEIPTPFLDRLEERTSGNPLFIVETLKSLQEEGIIARDGDSWRIRSDGDLSRIEIPHGIEAILLRRVRMLDPQHQRILEAMSVHDKPMSSKLLERLSDFARVNVLVSLRELENRGMVAKALDNGRLQFAISQPKLREILYHNIPAERCSSLHGALASAMLSEHDGNQEEIIEDLAFHYQRSSQAARALELTRMAGDMCRGIFAHERAVEHYRHVIRLTEGRSECYRVWFETQEQIGDIGTLSGDYELAQSSFDTLLEAEYIEGLGGADRARVLRKRGKVDEIGGEYDRALRCYKEAKDLLEACEGSTDHQAELIRVYNAIGWVYVCMGKYDKAMTISVDALRKVGGAEESREHALIFSTIGSSNYFKGNLEQAIEFHTRALQIRENREDVPEIIISLNNLGDAYLECCEYMDALKNYRQALKSAEQIGDAFGRAMALHNLAKTHIALGDDEQAEGFLRDSLKLSKDYKMRYLNNLNYLLRGKLKRRREEFAKAESDLFRVLGVFSKQGTRWGLTQCLLEVAELQQQRGTLDEAQRLTREAISNATSLNIASLETRARLLDLSIQRSLGAPEAELRERMKVASQHMDSLRSVELKAQIEIERAEIHVKLREIDAAREAYRVAAEHYREVADRLPPEYRDTYLAAHHVSAADLKQAADFREVPGSVAVSASANADPDDADDEPQPPPVTARGGTSKFQVLAPGQEEMLRVASLLQEMHQTGSPRMFLQKLMNCIIHATDAEEGFLLLRDGDKVRVLFACDRKGEKVKKAGSRLCLEALEDVWDSGVSILAGRVVDDARARGYESLYRENISSLAVLPMRPDPNARAALYLNNPGPTHLVAPSGSPALMAYQNLLQLCLLQISIPRAVSV
ncbi:MAG: serine/threonine-protein kinase PknK [Planctomycetota bacterium]